MYFPLFIFLIHFFFFHVHVETRSVFLYVQQSLFQSKDAIQPIGRDLSFSIIIMQVFHVQCSGGQCMWYVPSKRKCVGVASLTSNVTLHLIQLHFIYFSLLFFLFSFKFKINTLQPVHRMQLCSILNTQYAHDSLSLKQFYTLRAAENTNKLNIEH